MEYKDYYKVLGVPKDATDKDIKAAYRRLARKLHRQQSRGERLQREGEAADIQRKGLRQTDRVLQPASHEGADEADDDMHQTTVAAGPHQPSTDGADDSCNK